MINHLPRLPKAIDPNGYLTHFVYGAFLFLPIFGTGLLFVRSVFVASGLALFAVIGAAIFKEAEDKRSGRGVLDVWDLITTIGGGLLSFLTVYLLIIR